MTSQIEAPPSLPRSEASQTAPPYPVSFLDRFMDAIRQLPIPYGLTYLLLFLLQGLLNTILSWVDGWLPAYQFNSLTLIFPLWLWGPLFIMTYLNSVSQDALSSFRPLLEFDEQELQKLKLEFTSMPSRDVLLSGFTWLVFYCLLTAFLYDSVYRAFGLSAHLSAVVIFEGLVTFFIGGTIYYHSLRQLRLVNRTVKMVERFNLFRLEPVYAFSRVTSQIGISWMVMISLTLLFYPLKLANMLVFAMLVMQIFLAVAAFVLPLWFVNRRLVAEKRKHLAEHDRRVEATIRRLHSCLDKNELDEINQLNNAMTGLKGEREVLTGIPTWPWRAGTLTGFISAIILPVVLFVIQLIIGKLLGG